MSKARHGVRDALHQCGQSFVHGVPFLLLLAIILASVTLYHSSGLLLASHTSAFLLLLLLVCVPACGISFGSDETKGDFFEDLDLTGERLVNRELTIEVQVSNRYTVPVRIACYYEKPSELTEDQEEVGFEERARLIGERVIQPVIGASGDEPVEQTLRFNFSLPEAGKYNAACLTPASPENAIGVTFEIKAAADAAA
jgi:hypothetical protein